MLLQILLNRLPFRHVHLKNKFGKLIAVEELQIQCATQLGGHARVVLILSVVDCIYKYAYRRAEPAGTPCACLQVHQQRGCAPQAQESICTSACNMVPEPLCAACAGMTCAPLPQNVLLFPSIESKPLLYFISMPRRAG